MAANANDLDVVITLRPEGPGYCKVGEEQEITVRLKIKKNHKFVAGLRSVGSLEPKLDAISPTEVPKRGTRISEEKVTTRWSWSQVLSDTESEHYRVEYGFIVKPVTYSGDIQLLAIIKNMETGKKLCSDSQKHLTVYK